MADEGLEVEEPNNEEEVELFRQARLGNYAQDLLHNGVLKEYRETVREQLVEAIEQCDAKDDMGRFRLAQCLSTFSRFWEFVEGRVADGELASKQIDDLRRGGSRRFF